jgi:hypothetical protein
MRNTSFVLALAAAACGVGPADLGDAGSAVRVINIGASSVRQEITVTPGSPARGDTIVIASKLMNEGPGAVTTTVTICGLHVQGSLATTDPFARCAGYSMEAALAAGESVTDGRMLIVMASPGEWVIEVRHLLDPSTWVAVPVTVR